MFEVVEDPVPGEEVLDVGQVGGVAGNDPNVGRVALVPASGVRQLIQPSKNR